MSLVSAHDLEKSYGHKLVLDKASITIEEGDRLGLIGVNGAGKSTLIRVLLGIEEPDGGEVMRKRGLTWTVVEQQPKLDLDATVLEVVRAKQKANDEGEKPLHLAEAAMHALSLPPPDRRIGSLSQGEARRTALCAAFLEAPELLVLDEPTNHLDVEAIEWLEEELQHYPGGLILVTHDRYFLDRVATRHAELDRGDLRLYEGNYSEYLVLKAEREAMEARVEHKRERAIISELEWVRRRAPARTTKQRARLERFDALVASRPKTAVGEVRFRLPYPPRIGKTILELDGVTKSLGGKKLVSGLSLLLKKGDRIGVVGPNGIGKTTLLRMIMGEIAPDAGEIRFGERTEIVYADQRRSGLDDEHTVLEEVAGDSQYVHVGEEAVPVYGYLEGLLFDGQAQRAKLGSLSGGEKSRVALAKALRVSANVLILDEPTNDLDLPTLRVLEEALLDYPGCALIVSHDRYFLDRVATAILAFEGEGRVVLYEGTYDSWRARMRKRQASEAPALATQPASVPAAAPKPKTGPRKRTFNEERELAAMEEKILAAEAEVARLEAMVSDPVQIKKLGAELTARVADLDRAKHEVERLYVRWAELGAIGG